jgi:hypothetical protein
MTGRLRRAHDGEPLDGAPPSTSSQDTSAELERARDLWDDHPLAGAGGLIAHCMAEAEVEAEHLFVVSDAERHVAAHPGRRAAAQPRLTR